MRSCRLQRTVTAWVAALAVLLLALTPALSQAIGTDDGAAFSTVCRVAGAPATGADESQLPPPPPGHAAEHCPLCSLHAAVVVAAAAVTTWLLPDAGALPRPDATVAEPATRPPWVSAKPRGPPVSLLMH